MTINRILRFASIALAISIPTASSFAQCQLDPLTSIPFQSGDFFGDAIAVENDQMIVGAPFARDSSGIPVGAAFVFRFDGSDWRFEAKLEAPDGEVFDFFGWAVALGDGIAAVGSDNAEGGSSSGAVYTYRIDGGTWVFLEKLPAPGGSGDEFGVSVAISDGRMIVGAPGNSDQGAGAGTAYVYRFEKNKWSDATQLLPSDGDSFDEFGAAVAIDGGVAVIGAPRYNGDDGPTTGAAYVFLNKGERWQEEAVLRSSGGLGSDHFGASVAIDGEAVILGAPRFSQAAGSAFVFRRRARGWVQETELTPSDGQIGDRFGDAVYILGDVAITGASRHIDAQGDEVGAAYVSLFDGAQWAESFRLPSEDNRENSALGQAVALVGDFAVVGSFNRVLSFGIFGDDCDGDSLPDVCGPDCNENGVPDFCDILAGESLDTDADGIPDECQDCNENGEPDFSEIRADPSVDCNMNGVLDVCEIRVDTPGGPFFCTHNCAHDCNDNGVPDECDLADGTSVDQNGNGFPDDCEPDCNANGTPDSIDIAHGAIDANGNSFLDECEILPSCRSVTLMASDGEAGDRFGTTVAMDASWLVVGAPGDDQNDTDAGAAYVFQNVDSAWVEVAKLLAEGGQQNDQFGSIVEVENDMIAVGAPNYRIPGTGKRPGAVYVFRHRNARWVQEAILLASDGETEDGFGWAISLNGDTLGVGAPRDDDRGINSGSAYLFHADEAGWTEEVKLVPEDGADSLNFFGGSISLGGDEVMIGAPGADGAAPAAGAVYVFRAGVSRWSQVAKLIASDGAVLDDFGLGFDSDNDRAIIAALRQDGSETPFAKVYAFELEAREWRETQIIVEPETNTDFSNEGNVALNGDLVVIGMPRDDHNGAATGAAYVHQFDGVAWHPVQKLFDPDGNSGDSFGRAVAIERETVAITAFRHSGLGVDAGAVFVYDLNGTDCNSNETCDTTDLRDGTSVDRNKNGVPDECEPPGDVNGDGVVDDGDLQQLLEAWGPCLDCPEDINGDGFVGFEDLLILLAHWGS